MSNMSYCRFHNTCLDLSDCLNTMAGEDEYYQVKKDLSDKEYRAMKYLIEVCRKIVEIQDNNENVLEIEGNRKCLECEGKGKILICQDGSGDVKNSMEWVQCPTCKGTGDYTDE